MARSARALVVELVADVKEFVKGTQTADDALSDFVRGADRDLDHLERSSRDAARGVDQAFDGVGFERVGREAKDASDDAERAFDNLAREAKRSFQKVEQAADQVDIGPMKESFGEAGSEVGAEFAQNLGESLASGDLSGVARDTAGGLVSAFAGLAGPIGVGLAGVAAVATGIFAKMQAEAERRAQTIATITGTIFEQLAGDMQAALQKMLNGQAYQDFVAGFSSSGEVNEGLREMRRLAGLAGVSVADIADAFINGGPAADRLRARLDAIQSKSGNTVTNVRGVAAALGPSALAAKKLDDHISDAAVAFEQANTSARATWESLIGATEQARLFEAAASRASSSMSSAARAAARVRGAPGTVVGGRRLNG